MEGEREGRGLLLGKGRGPTSKGRGGEGGVEGRGMGTTSFWTLPPPLLWGKFTPKITETLFMPAKHFHFSLLRGAGTHPFTRGRHHAVP